MLEQTQMQYTTRGRVPSLSLTVVVSSLMQSRLRLYHLLLMARWQSLDHLLVPNERMELKDLALISMSSWLDRHSREVKRPVPPIETTLVLPRST